jgi:hypothetical protein
MEELDNIIKNLTKEIAEQHAKKEVLSRTIDKIREKNPNLIMPTSDELSEIRDQVKQEIEKTYGNIIKGI